MKLLHILIVHPEGNLYENPTLASLAGLLLREGHSITYSAYKLRYKSKANLNFFSLGLFYNKIRRFLVDKSGLVFINNYFGIPEKIIFNIKKPDLIIAVDREGLIDSGPLILHLKIPILFISFEIMFESETSVRFKRTERYYSKLINQWIIQDKDRANLLMEENKLSSGNFITVPVSSTKRIINSPEKQSLRDSLGISKEKKVVILIGSLSKRCLTKEICESTKTWPDDWVLILHGREGINNEKLSQLGINAEASEYNSKIFFSTNPATDMDDMEYIFSGISYGLAFYVPDYINRFSGKNILRIGMSAGKISTYLKYGVQVLCNNIGAYSELIRQNELGHVLNTPNEIGDILRSTGGKTVEQKVTDFFKKNIAFENFEKSIIQTIYSLTNN